MNPYKKEDHDEELIKYIAQLECLEKIRYKTFIQEYLPMEEVNDAQLAILKVSVLLLLKSYKIFVIDWQFLCLVRRATIEKRWDRATTNL